jgi:hypothetical protein
MSSYACAAPSGVLVSLNRAVYICCNYLRNLQYAMKRLIVEKSQHLYQWKKLRDLNIWHSILKMFRRKYTNLYGFLHSYISYIFSKSHNMKLCGSCFALLRVCYGWVYGASTKRGRGQIIWTFINILFYFKMYHETCPMATVIFILFNSINFYILAHIMFIMNLLK